MRFGIIGTNWITESFIAAASEVEGFTLTAVYSRTKERAQEFAAKHGAENIYTDLNDFASSDKIDAVYIASPNSLHNEQAILCMKNKKHVLCEKPIASNTRELQEMIRVAKEQKVLLMEALKTTYLPNFITIKENLHKIGKIRRYSASYCQYSSRYDKYKEGIILNAFKPEFSNGSLMDIGIYTIYPMVVLFGAPLSIKANAVMLDSGVDGQGSVLFEYPGMEAVITHSKIVNSYVPAEIQGEAGTMVIDKIHTPEMVQIFYKDGTSEDISVPQKSNSMYYEAQEFMNLVNNGTLEPTINSFTNSMSTHGILEEARKQIDLVYPAD
ncbi:putative dehydrogenase [Bacillus tianshenii]|uniref:Dehydrogenase n=1 Tax=Sutcliffiella tianshenii TaxID=1463404 RepID=A0ABS2NXB9_9BACI|nr:Gfo/Idh/MocA family oxidoreductase [Bacillus tianshenii]MBM7619269.1 putative dehydrogenase [Bacillus tianshenii]